MRRMVKRFVADQHGSATMKYGLIAAGLSLAIITVLQGISIRLTANLAETDSALR